jgi:hypothetical protein
MQFLFKHLDLREIEGRLSPEGKHLSARGKMYWDTDPGKNDSVTRIVALFLKEFWSADPSRRIRISDIEDHPNFPKQGAYSAAAFVPASVKRLARIKQIKLDFDREGVLIGRGSSWIET